MIEQEVFSPAGMPIVPVLMIFVSAEFESVTSIRPEIHRIEDVVYAVLGCIAGCILGLPFNRMMFQFLIADKWEHGWQLPSTLLLLIVILCLGSAALFVMRPIRRIGKRTKVADDRPGRQRKYVYGCISPH